MAIANSIAKSAHSMTPSDPVKRRRRRRRRSVSLEAEIRQSARQIYASGMADAMKAAALVIVARKLDEIRALVVAGGLSNVAIQNATPGSVSTAQPPPPPSAPEVKNPCVQCGRSGIYKSKPNQWNRTGSWFCRVHMALAGQIEAEDRFDRAMPPVAPPMEPAPQQVSPQGVQISPGASSLAEAMGMAEIVNEEMNSGNA
jgi:hypothetical protein